MSRRFYSQRLRTLCAQRANGPLDGKTQIAFFHVRCIYCAAFVLLLGAEVCIALFVHDAFVRPYLGDVLVIVLLYCLGRGPLGLRGRWLTPAVTALGVLAEGLQYFRLADRLGLAQESVLRVILGSTFDWADMACYLTGGLALALWELAWGKWCKG